MAKAGRQAGGQAGGVGKGCAAERHQKAASGSAVRGQQQQQQQLELTTLRSGSWPGWSCSVLGSPYEPFAFIILTFIRLFVALIRFDARPACPPARLPAFLSASAFCFLFLFHFNFHFIRFVLTDPPTVSVHLANEDPSRMVTRAEGQNVTFKCRADARPPVTSYSWFKNVSRTALIPIPSPSSPLDNQQLLTPIGQ